MSLGRARADPGRDAVEAAMQLKESGEDQALHRGHATLSHQPNASIRELPDGSFKWVHTLKLPHHNGSL